MLSIQSKALWFIATAISVCLLLGIVWLLRSPTPYSLALIVPSSGQHAADGKAVIRVVQEYLARVNAAGGVAGRPVALKVFDEPAEPRATARLARQVADDETVLLVLGHRYSDNALAAGPVYRAAGMPAITATASDNAISRDNPWFFMLAPNNAFQGAFTAHYLQRVFPSKTIGVIYAADAFGTSLFKQFQSTADRLGLDIVYRRKLDRRQADPDTALLALAADFNTRQQPDILYLATQARESAALLSQIQSAEQQLVVVCSSVCAGRQFVDYIKGYARERAQPGFYTDGLYVMSPFMLDIANQPAQDWHQHIGKTLPAAAPVTAAAYYHDAARLAVAALRTLAPAGLDASTDVSAARAQLRQALTEYYDPDHSLPGVTGPLYFDHNGNANSTLAAGIYAGQRLRSAPIQYRPGEDQHALPVQTLLDDLYAGEVFLVGGRLMRRTQVVYAGITVNSVSQIDTAASLFSLDFYLWFRFHGEFADREIHFEQAATPIALGEPVLDATQQGMTTRAYRLNGTFTSDFRFADYPFDRQTLAVRFYHATARADRLLYVSDAPGPAPSQASSVAAGKPVVDVGDWVLRKILLFQDRLTYASGVDRAGQHPSVAYSRFNLLFDIQRAGWSVLLKNLFPILLLAALAYLAYFTPASKDQARIKLGSSALITTAFFHLKFIAAMAVDELMVIEYCFFAVYLLSALVIFISMLNAHYHSTTDNNDTDSRQADLRIRRLDWFGKVFHPTLIILLVGMLMYRYG